VAWSFDPIPAAPGAIRRRAQTVLTGWGIADEPTEDVLLVLSELVANVVDHARTRMTVTIEHLAGFVLIAVTDASDEPPRQQPHSIHAARGRGLQLVAALSLRWDTIPAIPGPGKTVWAEIPCNTP
jgi:anti-sigma regulatory factor (Ser/Thr protein kinase)